MVLQVSSTKSAFVSYKHLPHLLKLAKDRTSLPCLVSYVDLRPHFSLETFVSYMPQGFYHILVS